MPGRDRAEGTTIRGNNEEAAVQPPRSRDGVAATVNSLVSAGKQSPRSNRYVMDKLCIDTIRTLSMDAVQQADSGHLGTPKHVRQWFTHSLFQRRFLRSIRKIRYDLIRDPILCCPMDTPRCCCTRYCILPA